MATGGTELNIWDSAGNPGGQGVAPIKSTGGSISNYRRDNATKMVIACNDWYEKCAELEKAEVKWLEANAVVIDVQKPLYG